MTLRELRLWHWNLAVAARKRERTFRGLQGGTNQRNCRQAQDDWNFHRAAATALDPHVPGAVQDDQRAAS